MINRIKGAGHQPLTAQLKADWELMFTIHPLAFEGLAFMPEAQEQAPVNDIEMPTFGLVDEQKQGVDYNKAPIPISIIESNDGDAFDFVADDGESLGFGEAEIFRCRLSVHLPEGAALMYPEQIGDKQVYRWWYVQSASTGPYKHFQEAMIYTCIPFGGFELDEN